MGTAGADNTPSWGAIAVRLLGFMAVLGAAGAGLIAGMVQWDREQERADAARTAVAGQAAEAVVRDISSSKGALEALGASMSVGVFSEEGFLSPARIVQRRGSIATVAWIPEVTPAERDRFERNLGLPVTQAMLGSPLMPAPRDAVVHPVALQVSEPGWIDMRGRDLSLAPAVRYLNQATRSNPGRAMMSPPTRLTNGQRGIALAAAVFDRRGEFMGAVAATIKTPALLATAAPTLTEGMALVITDGDRALLGDPDTASLHAGPTVELGGRTWTFAVTGGPEPSASMPLLLALVGLLSAAALAGLFMTWLRRERYARRLVEQKLREQLELEDELRHERDWSAGLLSSMHDGVIVTDSEGRITFVNDALCAMTGHARDRLIGSGPSNWPHVDAGKRAAIMSNAARQAGTAAGVRQLEARFTRADGTDLPVGVSISPLAPAAGASGWISVVHDLTARHRIEDDLRSERDRLARILGALMDGLLLVDPTGRITEVNDALCAMTGYSRHELVGRGGAGHHLPFLSDRSVADLSAALPDGSAQGQAEFAQDLVRRDGATVHTLVSVAPP